MRVDRWYLQLAAIKHCYLPVYIKKLNVLSILLNQFFVCLFVCSCFHYSGIHKLEWSTVVQIVYLGHSRSSGSDTRVPKTKLHTAMNISKVFNVLSIAGNSDLQFASTISLSRGGGRSFFFSSFFCCWGGGGGGGDVRQYYFFVTWWWPVTVVVSGECLPQGSSSAKKLRLALQSRREDDGCASICISPHSICPF